MGLNFDSQAVILVLIGLVSFFWVIYFGFTIMQPRIVFCPWRCKCCKHQDDDDDDDEN